MRFPKLLVTLACALVPLVAAGGAAAAEPPNPDDPCSSAGRNTCGTNGVGSYETYRYGLRWFGDFRGAVPGERQTFCIDLRFWYPSAAHRYRAVDGPLRNRDGKAVSLERQRRIAYAIWRYGRSNSAAQQAAVMLYVHSQMGDARAGEIDPSAVGRATVALYRRIVREAPRLHGPYRLEVRLPDGLRVGRAATATVRVLSASGVAVPGVALGLSATGATGAPGRAETPASGVLRVALTPTRAAGLRLAVDATGLPSNLPTVYAATTRAAAPNAQRLVAPASQRLRAVAEAPVAQAQLAITTAATPATLLAGGTSADRVTVRGALGSFQSVATVRLYGPFRTREAIRCDGAPAFSTTVEFRGPGSFDTPGQALAAPGLYTYVIDVPGDADHVGLVTPCGVPAETVRVEVQPTLRTEVSDQRVAPGTAITDLIVVRGLAGEPVRVVADLFGPFATRAAIACDGQPVWSGQLDVAADGDVRTDPFTLTVPGYYTYRERIAASGFVRGVETACGEAAETTIATGAPRIVTEVSSQTALVGSSITDRATVSGLGALEATVRVELWGPFASADAIACTGTPFATSEFTAQGDGTTTTPAVRLTRAGYYTYRESIAASEAFDAVQTACGEVAETTLARAEPTVTTLVSDEVVRPGSRISDAIRVRGLARTPATIAVDLYGPFATRAAIRCGGTPVWSGRLSVPGDGTYRSQAVRVARAGLYTYRERLVGGAHVRPATTECALLEETSLGAPQIVTGRGDVAVEVRAPAAGGRTPVRVQLPGLGIDAPVAPVGIDIGNGVLGVPTAVGGTGWWRDGATPGDRAGAVLIAGHVDSARAGTGAFFRLKDARRGDRIRVVLASGRGASYRVVSVRTVRKTRLPLSVWSRKGDARLVLVTCGGPFDTASGHYRDNVVVTAVPA